MPIPKCSMCEADGVLAKHYAGVRQWRCMEHLDADCPECAINRQHYLTHSLVPVDDKEQG